MYIPALHNFGTKERFRTIGTGVITRVLHAPHSGAKSGQVAVTAQKCWILRRVPAIPVGIVQGGQNKCDALPARKFGFCQISS